MLLSCRARSSDWVLWCLLQEIVHVVGVFKMFVFHWDSLVPDKDGAYATTCLAVFQHVSSCMRCF